MHHNPRKNVLWWKGDPAGDDEWPILRDALRRLKAARGARQAPYVDTTPYVNWNAMMASAFLHAGAVLDRPECNQLALRSEEHTSELQSLAYLVCRLLLEKKKKNNMNKRNRRYRR